MEGRLACRYRGNGLLCGVAAPREREPLLAAQGAPTVSCECAAQPRTQEQVLAKFREEMGKGMYDDPLQRELYEKQGVEQLSAFLATHAAR